MWQSYARLLSCAVSDIINININIMTSNNIFNKVGEQVYVACLNSKGERIIHPCYLDAIKITGGGSPFATITTDLNIAFRLPLHFVFSTKEEALANLSFMTDLYPLPAINVSRENVIFAMIARALVYKQEFGNMYIEELTKAIEIIKSQSLIFAFNTLRELSNNTFIFRVCDDIICGNVHIILETFRGQSTLIKINIPPKMMTEIYEISHSLKL